ncbi:threonylcarbamoyl-AMP synthase [Patescibacteria group bacterium]|nr:threonylcarbamoyl-AMP synthase [Patescibacteria group bacterium]
MMKEQIQEAVKALHEGKVVAHPTETCYGLAADIFQVGAIKRLYSLKKMKKEKPVSILVRDLREAEAYGEFSEKARELAKEYWPGPLTLVVPRKKSLPLWLNYGNDFVGFRVSSNKKTRQLVVAFGGPLTTTSANLSGQIHVYKVQDFLDQGLVPDYILDGGQIGETAPSTILKVVGEEVQILRQGPI